MNIRELMDIALEMAGLESMPHDTVISVEGENIKRILMGVDMGTPELILGRDMKYDCVVSHHPKADSAVCEFHKVLDFQIDKMVEFGVPINKAQKVLEKKKNIINIGDHVANYDLVSSAARLMKMPFMNIHMPADLIGQKIVQDHLDEKFKDNPRKTLKDVVDAICEIDEYKRAKTEPVIRVGSPGSYAGKIAVLYAGGTNGGEDVYKAYFEAGVGTIVAMHAPKAVIDEVRKQNIGNIIIAGHMASDSIGLNRIIAKWEEKGMEVTKMAGII